MPRYFGGYYFDKYKHFFDYKCKKYSFKIDLENGLLLFSSKILSFGGKHLPFDLHLKYNQSHINRGLHFDTGFPRAFKTNYHVFLEFQPSNDTYWYEDSDGYTHIFKLAENSSSLYYDSFGTGMMLTAIYGGFKIFDEDGNYQQFDADGRLIKIHKQVTATYAAELTIAYCDYSIRISSITDNYGRSVSFSYGATYVSITYAYNEVLHLTYNYNSFFLTSLKINLDNYYPEDYLTFSSFLDSVSLSTGEALSFSYTNSKITLFQTNINQDVYDISYDYQDDKKSIITNARCIATVYDCNHEQIVKQTNDGSANLSYLSLDSNLMTCIIKDQTNVNNQAITFNLAMPQAAPIYTLSIPTLTTNYQTDNSTNNNVLSKRMYLFCVEIEEIMGVGELIISLHDSLENKLAVLSFNGKTTMLAAPVGIKESLARNYHLHITNTAPNSVTIKQVRLVPLIGSFSALCSNVDTGGPVFFYGDDPHYILSEGNSLSFNPTISNSYTFRLKLDDYLTNERLFRKRNGNNFRFWCNDKTTLIDNASAVAVSMDNNNSLCWNASSDFIRFESLSGNPVDATFYLINGGDDNSFTITKVSHDSASFRTGYSSYYYEKEEIRYAGGGTSHSTFYDYDSNYSLCEIEKDDGLKESNTFDNHGNLTEETLSHADTTKQIKTEYQYGSSDDDLYRVYKLIDSTIEHVRYDYDSFGFLANTYYPNGLTEKYQYSAATEEKLRQIKYQSTDITVVQQLDDVDSDNIHYLSYSNDYHLEYQNGKLSSIANNNQQFIWMSYYPTIYNGQILYDRYYTYYSNSYSFYREYDAYGRIIIDDKLSYEYDDFSNVSRIQDTSLNINNSYTIYQYNYFDDLTSIIVQPNDLSLQIEYDDYRRITKRTYGLNNLTILENNYFYYDNPDLEQAIKKTTVSIPSPIPNSSPTLIDVVDEIDEFSRVSNRHISISGMSTNRNIIYCTCGSNSNLTNYRVKSVTYSDDVTSPFFANLILQRVSRIEKYFYDCVGNIIRIDNTTSPLNIYTIAEYSYDALSRLIRENNKAFNKSFLYSYDKNGNILRKEEYAYSLNSDNPTLSNPTASHIYSYDQTYPNRLISYDNQSIAYDNMGNPTTYRGKTLTWIRGTLLQSVVDANNNAISLTYDGFKQRIAKEIGNVTTNYSYIDGKLILEQKGNQTIKYFYAHDGVDGFVLDDTVYFYEKNIQGDVITIKDINRLVVAKYEYDAWGNHIVKDSSNNINTSSTFIGNVNPIRYRSYYYDVDLQMYWLTTRYYDPEIGRFISPDHYSYLDYKKLHGLNLYAYSKNNPVMYYDPSGHFWWLIPVIVAVCAIVLATTLKSDSKTTKQPDKNEIPTGDDASDYDLNHPFEGDGFTIYYKVGENPTNSDMSELKIYKSWRFSSEEMRAFLEFLQGKYKDVYINIDKIMNEWVWHNIAYSIGFKPDRSGSLDAYFNHDDINHWYSLILNWRLWY